MRYKIFVIILFSIASSQSLFHRFLGADSFSGSARSTAMGKTHLLNSSGSNNVRYNPALLSDFDSNTFIDFQVKRFSSFERWSMPVRDSFDEVLTQADYVSNEFSKYLVSGGATLSFDIPFFGSLGMGFSYYPLTHFTYSYSEEVRGSYSAEDGEYASKDPIVGYQNLNIIGVPFSSSIGIGFKLNIFGNVSSKIGASFNRTSPFTIEDEVNIDSIYTDLTNLSLLADINNRYKIDSNNFITFSTQLNLSTASTIGLYYETDLLLKTNESNVSIDTTNGLFQYWDGTEYLPLGFNYLKPSVIAFSWGFNPPATQPLLVNFEYNKIFFNNHLSLKDVNKWKFGFEYLTQLGTPVRGGLVYSTSSLNTLPSETIFTFGTGKKINNITIDISGTYQLYEFKYPDLFEVEGDVRPDYYDTIRDSQMNLFLAFSYFF